MEQTQVDVKRHHQHARDTTTARTVAWFLFCVVTPQTCLFKQFRKTFAVFATHGDHHHKNYNPLTCQMFSSHHHTNVIISNHTFQYETFGIIMITTTISTSPHHGRCGQLVAWTPCAPHHQPPPVSPQPPSTTLIVNTRRSPRLLTTTQQNVVVECCFVNLASVNKTLTPITHLFLTNSPSPLPPLYNKLLLLPSSSSSHLPTCHGLCAHAPLSKEPTYPFFGIRSSCWRTITPHHDDHVAQPPLPRPSPQQLDNMIITEASPIPPPQHITACAHLMTLLHTTTA